MHRTRPVVLLLVVAFIGACTAAPEGVVVTVGSETTSTSTTPPPETTTTPQTTSTTEPVEVEFTAEWDPGFTFTVPAGWRRHPDTTPQNFEMSTSGRHLIFSRSSPNSVEDWREELTTAVDLIVSDPTDIEIGSAPGFYVDVRLNTETAEQCNRVIYAGPCSKFLDLTDNTAMFFFPDSGYGIWVVEVEGTTVLIITSSSDPGFEAWAEIVKEALSTLVWD